MCYDILGYKNISTGLRIFVKKGGKMYQCLKINSIEKQTYIKIGRNFL